MNLCWVVEGLGEEDMTGDKADTFANGRQMLCQSSYIRDFHYDCTMSTTIQARLDRQTETALKALMRQLNWSQSRAVCEGLRMLAACYGKRSSPKVIGLGRFESGIEDVGSSRKHLKGLGR